MECTLRTCLLLHGKLQNFVFLNTNANLLVFFWSKVSSWGGYVFLINLIPLHVLTLILTGRFSHRVYVAYSAVYTLGTLLSMQVAFVGFQPVQSSEHMLVRLGFAKALHFEKSTIYIILFRLGIWCLWFVSVACVHRLCT
jgi:asparagine N-glycosylation enzyme membrane subunit Stt3